MNLKFAGDICQFEKGVVGLFTDCCETSSMYDICAQCKGVFQNTACHNPNLNNYIPLVFEMLTASTVLFSVLVFHSAKDPKNLFASQLIFIAPNATTCLEAKTNS